MSVEETPRPIVGSVLSLIGGILSHIIGLIFSLIYLTSPPYQIHRIGYLILSAFQVLLIALWFLAVGTIVTVGSVMLYERPENHKKWGVVITVFSILGGGGLVGLIGGILAITWKPIKPMPLVAINRICVKCERVLKEDYKFCPYCGKNLEDESKSKKKEP